jgi:hypothetical protein
MNNTHNTSNKVLTNKGIKGMRNDSKANENDFNQNSIEMEFGMRLKNEKYGDCGSKYCKLNGILHEWTGVFWQPVDIKVVEQMAWDWLCIENASSATPKAAKSCGEAAIYACANMPIRNRNDLIVKLHVNLTHQMH